MSTNRSTIDGLANSDKTAQTRMMNIWRENMEKTRQESQAPVALNKEEKGSSLEEKIRNREVPCPTCMNRKYKDDSDDSGVSFQSATKLNKATAGVDVMKHENEHVNRNKNGANDKDKAKAKEPEKRSIEVSTVSITYDICPDCGRQYVSGGITRTSSMALHSRSHRDGGEGEDDDAKNKGIPKVRGLNYEA